MLCTCMYAAVNFEILLPYLGLVQNSGTNPSTNCLLSLLYRMGPPR